MLPYWEHSTRDMRVIAIPRLRAYWQAHPQAEAPLRSWYAIARRAQWTSPTEVKAIYRNASVLPGNRVVFNIKGNDICLVVAVHYDRKIMFIRFIGSHAQYDKIDAQKI
jgi:mRNA interferase HigB